jgi:hypothetical protein
MPVSSSTSSHNLSDLSLTLCLVGLQIYSNINHLVSLVLCTYIFHVFMYVVISVLSIVSLAHMRAI